MNMIDFSAKLSIYELLALTLSAITILSSIIKWVWKTWIRKAKLDFLPNGTATLFYNQSGSYLRIDGVYAAINKAISIKNITVSIQRKKDDAKLNLAWSIFISPVNQTLVGNYIHTTEMAHPFRIDADSMMCAFIEFVDPFDSAEKAFRLNTEKLFAKAKNAIIFHETYDDALVTYRQSEEYHQASNLIKKDFFWEIGQYDIQICAYYGKSKKNYLFSMYVDENTYKKLQGNVDEALIEPLKKDYGVKLNFQNAVVKILEKNSSV